MPKPSKLAHFVVRTARLDELAEWYLKVTQSRVVMRDDRRCFMTYDDEHHRIGIIRIPELAAKSPGTAGVDHIGFTFASISELAQTYGALKRDGIVPFMCTNHGPSTSFYYTDPDGNNVELLCDNFDTVAEADAFVESEVFKRNPRGLKINPDILLQRLDEGVPEAELRSYRAIV